MAREVYFCIENIKIILCIYKPSLSIPKYPIISYDKDIPKNINQEYKVPSSSLIIL